LQETAGRHYAGYPRTARADASVATPEAKSGDAFVAVGLARDAALPTTTGAAVAVLLRSPDIDAVRLPDGVAIVREDRLPAAPGSGEDADDVSRQPGMGAQLVALARSVWAYRELLQQITLRDVRIRYAQAVMGFGWAVLMPAIIVGAGILVRSAMAYVSGSQIETTEIYGLALKALPWAFFVGAVGFATTSLTGNFELVTKVAFPRIVLPLAAVLTQVVDSAIGASVVLLLAPFLGVPVSATWLWLPLLALLVLVYTSAAAIFLSCANLFFRDVKYLVQVFLTFGIFFTPVFFEPEMLGPLGGKLLMLNPLSPLLEGLRLAVAHGHDLAQPLHVLDAHGRSVLAWTPWYLVYAGVVAIGGLLASALLFRRLEILFAEHV
jgi:ABC-type polysaccharide/polyol phosphate export permease